MARKKTEEVVVEETVVTEEVVETPVVEKKTTKKKTLTGVVDNCDKVNVRSEAAVGDNVKYILVAGSQVAIVDDSNEEFYKLDDGNFIMKKFVKLG